MLRNFFELKRTYFFWGLHNNCSDTEGQIEAESENLGTQAIESSVLCAALYQSVRVVGSSRTKRGKGSGRVRTDSAAIYKGLQPSAILV